MASYGTKYYISPLIGLFGSYNYKEITKRDYEKLIKATNILLAALNFEESFQIIISNHIDYETYIFKDSFQKSMQQLGEQQLTNIRVEANRYISNTLASIYNYLQYGNRCIKTITKKDLFNEKKNEFLKKHTVFSFMNELRHYNQHYGFAAPAFEIFRGIKEVDGNQYLETKIKPSVKLSSLKSDSDFYDYYKQTGKENPELDKIRKDSINNLLEENDSDMRDITILFRTFLDQLWNMHKQIRDKVGIKVSSQVEHLQVTGKEILNKDALSYFDGFEVSKSIDGINNSTAIPIRIIYEYKSIIKKYNIIA
ncbi:hypothetical protein Lche_0001, partial [Legionella cherrii]